MKLTLIISLLIAFPASAGMVRVVAVQDARTLIIERDGQPHPVRLGGITITDELRATELLRWTAVASWVLVEKRADGEHFVWRSPDALFLNRELVLRGYARATQHGIEPESNVRVTYLGEVDPAGPQRATAAAPSRTDSDRRPRSSASPSRGNRTRGAASARRRGSPSRNR